MDDDKLTFNRSFTQQEAIPESAIAAAVEVMQSGRLHRYNLGENSKRSVVDELELAFARYQGVRFTLATASGGYALQLALRASGVAEGDAVLTNAFTLSPVPGAIVAVGAKPVFVETTDKLVIDIDDLARKLKNGIATTVLLSHMRGHIADMERIVALTEQYAVTLIEDCAHTMGARFGKQLSGTFGHVGCFSTQTYKHINSGEGGLLCSDDADLMARAILLSGSYMLYERHAAGPPRECFGPYRNLMPNMSGRMDNLRAAVLLPQLDELDTRAAMWRSRHEVLADSLSVSPRVQLPLPHEKSRAVPSSLQFRVPSLDEEAARDLPERCRKRGVELKWFGAPEPHGYTSAHTSWHYADAQSLPETDRILSRLYDIRLPLTFSVEDCQIIGRIVVSELAAPD